MIYLKSVSIAHALSPETFAEDGIFHVKPSTVTFLQKSTFEVAIDFGVDF